MKSKINDIKKQIEDVSSLPARLAKQLIYHDTYEFETKMLKCVKNGDVEALIELFKKQQLGNIGKLSNDYHKQLQNIFITTSTIVSRAAIESGLNINEALTLSDEYILSSETKISDEDILNLQYEMVIDYTKRIHDLKFNQNYSKTTRTIILFLNNHLNEQLNIKTISCITGLCPSQCERLFKADTHSTISNYFNELKIKKAKELLKDTNLSILDISTMLGFSSQSYFCKMFKKYTNINPIKYRQSV